MKLAARPRLGTLFGILLIVLSACSDDPPPVEDTATSTPVPAGDTGTPSPAPGTSRMSLDEYVASMCTEGVGVEDLDMTYEEYSADLEHGLKALEAIIPPPEVAEYHNAIVAYLTTVKSVVDDYSGSREDVISSEGLTAMVEAGFDNIEAMNKAISATAHDVRERLAAAGCIDEDFGAWETQWETQSGTVSTDTPEGVTSTLTPIPTWQAMQASTPTASVTSTQLTTSTAAPTPPPTPAPPATPEPAPTVPPTPTPPATSTATPTPTPTPDQPAVSECESRDRKALVAIYNAMGGTDWRRDQNWLSEEPVGAWYGVTVGDDGCANRLELRSNGLGGELPPELGSLSELRVLDLSDNNQLRGEIPTELGNLSLLEHLDLSDQTGQSDQSFAFTGAIPAELGNLTNLKSLKLSWHALSGELPAQLGNLVQLESLEVRSNNLRGTIPAELGSLPRLRSLILGWNDFSGEVPQELGSITTLEWLDLGLNNLSGQIPSELGALSRLERLDLRENNLSGRIPPELGSLSSLTTLRLDNNTLEDGIPAELGNLSSLDTLNLSDNGLSGGIPGTLGRLRDLEALDLSANNLSGSIPEELGGLSRLESLDLRENSLSGGIPAELAQLPGLIRLFVSGNEFTGCIPPELRPLERSRIFDPLRRWLGFSLPRDNTDLHELGLPYCSVPPNQRYAHEGSAIRISWDPVEGADYYIVYHDHFFSFSCRLDSDGNASFCEELATNVVGTTYLHTDPSDGDNYYWVVACGGDECSDINSPNPATPVGTDSTGRANETTTQQELAFSEDGPAARSIPENTPAGINVGEPVSADAGQALTYAMSGPDAGSFTIIPSSGQMRTKEGVIYDYETKNRYEVSNQRMMIVAAGPAAAAFSNGAQRLGDVAAAYYAFRPEAPVLAVPAVLRGISTAPTPILASFERNRFYPLRYAGSQYKLAAPTITQLQAVCMQQDSETYRIPTRGDRYFSQPKAAEDPVQLCQRDCVLNESANVQECVWKCEENAGTN